jgi:hypothetical protein
MPDYLTRDDTYRFRDSIGRNAYNEKLYAAQRRAPDGLVFLSHSSKDNELVPAVIMILEGHGSRVYVDTKDPTLSSYSGREVAVQLRSRIQKCKKFIVLVTENIKDSKWVPWELGLSDGYKHPRNTLVFPSVDDALKTSWLHQEYLEAYDRVVWGPMVGQPNALWMVWNQEENTACTLQEWLARN